MAGWPVRIFRYFLLTVCLTVLSACGGDSGSSSKAGMDTGVPTMGGTPTEGSTGQPAPPSATTDSIALPQNSAGQVTLQGTLTYDHVPFQAGPGTGLDYANSTARPARGVTVELLDAQGQLTATTRTDSAGDYRFFVEPNRQVAVRVLAELSGEDPAVWDIEVRDNTQGQALFTLNGALASVGDAGSQIRDLHAPSGWNGSGYTESRSAAPFAILDAVYTALRAVIESAPGVVLPPLNIYWSPDNIAVRGDWSDGHIGTSFFTSPSSGPAIYILGAADNDTDEYDRGVVQHEFAHYLEHETARSDSLGGSHRITSRLDMRVAFSEAWGNAFAGLVSGDSRYRDSMYQQQSKGFTIDVEETSFGTAGWFSEGSIQALLYDFGDSQNDEGDELSLGLAPLYKALTDNEYLAFSGVASIYAFAESLKKHHPLHVQPITRMMQWHEIYGTGWFGEGETNDGRVDSVLPVYKTLVPGGSLYLCSDKSAQKYNGLGVRQLVRVHLPRRANYRFTAVKFGGTLERTNPQLRLLHQGVVLAHAMGATVDSENLEWPLSAGEYILELFEASNTDMRSETGGEACFNLSLH